MNEEAHNRQLTGATRTRMSIPFRPYRNHYGHNPEYYDESYQFEDGRIRLKYSYPCADQAFASYHRNKIEYNPRFDCDLLRLQEIFRNPTRRRWRRPQQQSTYDDNSEEPKMEFAWSEHLSVLLAGTRDAQSPLQLLKGYENTIIRAIYTMVYQGWVDSFRFTSSAILSRRSITGATYFQNGIAKSCAMPLGDVLLLDDGYYEMDEVLVRSGNDHPKVAFFVCETGIQFPDPQDINVHMMPFIMGDISSLPSYLHQYYDMIMKCQGDYRMLGEGDYSKCGQVCYVTVMEKFVEKDATQRRDGLHVEAVNPFSTEAELSLEHQWGIGHAYGPDELNGGMYMVTNRDHATAVWDALVTDLSEVNRRGGIEHLRSYIGTSYVLRAGDMVWYTDRTPQEELPQPESGYLQYFCLVTSNISVWFEDHWTPNPLVPLPANVTVIK